MTINGSDDLALSLPYMGSLHSLTVLDPANTVAARPVPQRDAVSRPKRGAMTISPVAAQLELAPARPNHGYTKD